MAPKLSQTIEEHYDEPGVVSYFQGIDDQAGSLMQEKLEVVDPHPDQVGRWEPVSVCRFLFPTCGIELFKARPLLNPTQQTTLAMPE